MAVIWSSWSRTAYKKLRYVSDSILPTKEMIDPSTDIVAGSGPYQMMPSSSGVGVGSGDGVTVGSTVGVGGGVGVRVGAGVGVGVGGAVGVTVGVGVGESVGVGVRVGAGVGSTVGVAVGGGVEVGAGVAVGSDWEHAAVIASPTTHSSRTPMESRREGCLRESDRYVLIINVSKTG